MFQSDSGVLWRAVCSCLPACIPGRAYIAQDVYIHIRFVTSCICRFAALCISCMCKASNCVAFSCHADANVISVDLAEQNGVSTCGKSHPDQEPHRHALHRNIYYFTTHSSAKFHAWNASAVTNSIHWSVTLYLIVSVNSFVKKFCKF